MLVSTKDGPESIRNTGLTSMEKRRESNKERLANKICSVGKSCGFAQFLPCRLKVY